MYSKAKNADFWVNAGNHKNLKSLQGKFHQYALLQSFQKKNVYGVNGRSKVMQNDYFENGNSRVDLVLMDYVKIFHPSLVPKHQLVYLNKIEP